MKITMYELLGLVKDGKTPKRIIYDQYVYVWNKEDGNYTREADIGTSLNWDYIVVNCLNEPVEILNKSIEKKKIPEKIKDKYCSQISKVELAQKYNEIIDYLNSKGDE